MPPARKFDLEKNKTFDLNKDELTKIQVDLTWKCGADLDVSAFLLNEDGVFVEDADFVYYKSNHRSEPYDMQIYGSRKNWRNATVPMSYDGSVLGSPDDPGDSDEDGDDAGETMHVDLDKVRPQVREIVFCVTVHTPDVSFKDVRNSEIIISDEETGEELCSYKLKEAFSTETAVVAGC